MHGPSYRAQQPILVRAPRHQALPVPPLPDLGDPTPAGAAARRAWLHRAWAVEDLAEAVRHASPGLGGTIDALVAATEPGDDAVGRAVTSLGGYVLRATGRPTPFGLFAGITEGEFADRARASWGTGHTVIASAEGRWLADIIDRLVADPRVRTHLPVVANNAVRVNGDRLVVPWRRRRRGEENTAVRCASLRRTSLVRALLAQAASPVPYQEAVDKTAAESGYDTARVAAVLDVLIEQQAVLTGLTPPTTVTDQLGHIRAVLAAAGVHRAQAGGLVGVLEDIGALVHEHNTPGCGDGRKLRAQLRERMLPVGTSDDQLALDVRLDADVALPRAVAWEAEKAAGLVARLSAEPAGTAAWIRYRKRFADRYGHGVLVPVGDLLDPATGLGLPEDFHGTSRAPEPALSHRDAVLMAQAQQAAAEHRELVLDDRLIDELTHGQPRPGRGPATVELKTAVHAATRQDLDAGRFTLVVDRISRGWGHFSGGRFAALLHTSTPAERGLLATLAARPTGTSGARPVQLAYPGLQRSHPVVTTTLRLGPDVITLSEHPSPAGTGRPPIPLDDLAVLSDQDTDRLHLVRLSTREVLEPYAPHPLQLEFLTPTMGRFLEELQRGQDARLTNTTGILSTWDWGAARLLPHLPRVRAGRTVLSPASWDAGHAGLPGPDASFARWDDAFTELTDRWGIPDRVHVQWFDQRRTLDLSDTNHRTMLRDQLTRQRPAGRTLIVEAEPADGYGWCGGRPHEIIMLLSSRTQAPPLTTPRTAPVAHRGDTHMPGASRHVSIRLHTGPAQLPTLLTEQLPLLIAELGEPAWWVTRDDEHPGRAELTIRMPRPQDTAPALQTIGHWAQNLNAARALGHLTFVPYRPRPGIWGEGHLHAAAENVLAGDTACVLHEHTQASTGGELLVRAALNTLALATGFTGSPEAGFAWIGAQPKPASTRPLDRDLDRAVRERGLPQPGLDSETGPQSGQASEPAGGLWLRRERALGAYAALLGDSGRSPDWALHHLIRAHLHLALADPADRAVAWRLARSAALAHRAVPAGTRQSSPPPPGGRDAQDDARVQHPTGGRPRPVLGRLVAALRRLLYAQDHPDLRLMRELQLLDPPLYVQRGNPARTGHEWHAYPGQEHDAADGAGR
ncbi:lantibiotic dehydratase [Streptomyces anthocyanicus]|uniref:lantibiotic dehydratase n=1 Tax=Streptomyces anthocyanicus TaxID=68174 RepID=UPI00381A7CFA